MSAVERVTVTLPAEMVAALNGAVADGQYASSSEVVQEALRDWTVKHSLHLEQLVSLKQDIDRGIADLAEGRIKTFDSAQIIERGRALLAARSPSA